MNSHLSRTLACVLLLLCFVPSLQAANRARDLPPTYRHWLNEEVTYIISSSERKQFLSLSSDAERDSFIAEFWKIRNPDPASSVNTYKEEIYRRLAYANQHFGSIDLQDGWRTDEGRIYIILGAPQQIVTYPAARNVRPMQIWFYQSPSRVLPPYFNLIFYKRSAGEDYTLYSPNSDGPARLVSTLEAMNDQKRSLDILRKSLGDEVARTALSLIPGDNVNLDAYEPSLTSDMLLGEIAGLPDNPLTKELLEANRLSEQVTTSLFLGASDSTLSDDTFRDERGRTTLSYLLRMRSADPSIIGTRKDGSAYYDQTLRTTVLTEAGKRVYEQEEQLTGNLTQAQAEIARKKRFGAEARLPLEPGKYILVATLTNNLNHVAMRQRATVTVPARKSSVVGLSGLLAYTLPAAVPDPRGALPFSISRYRFSPIGTENVYLPQGHRLSLVFQLWLDPKSDAPAAPEKIHLHYVFGSITATQQQPAHEDEDVDAGNRDTAGNLLTGHALDTADLAPGSYQVVVSANRVGESRMAYATLNLHIEPAASYVDTWTAYGAEGTGGDALDDYQRGLAAEAQGNDAAAQADYTRSLAEGPREMRTLDKLAAVLERRGQTAELAALIQQPLLTTTAVEPATVSAIAQAALNQKGNPKAVARMLEAQIKLQPPSAGLYRVLADASEASGNMSRAREVRALAANLK